MSDKKELTGYPSIDKPWLNYYGDEAINAPIPECSIYEYLLDNNKDYPKDIAINYCGRKISYGELFKNIDKTAAAFLALDVEPGEIVTVALPSIPEVLYVVYALNKIGAVANMIHPLAGGKETISYINEVQSRFVVIFDGAYESIAKEIGNTSTKKVIIISVANSLPLTLRVAYNLRTKMYTGDGEIFQKWKDFILGGAGTSVKPIKRNCHDTAIISHTGGTTGEPKGCLLSNYSINAEVWQVGKTMNPSRQECMMAVLPPFVNYSLTNGMFEPLAFGMKLVLIPQYDPLKFADYVEKYKVNHVNTIPAFCEALLHISSIEKYDLSSLKYVVYGGEGMKEEVEEAVNALLEKCGCRYTLKKGLGMTELTSAASATFEGVNDLGSVGIPFPKMVVKATDIDTGKEKRYGEEGEICITGPTIMQGYYNNPVATDELIKVHEDGMRWIHTGDLGFLDENGVIFITGRIKRIMMTKGKDGNITKLFPDRIEKIINSHPAVKLCCVVGIADDQRIHYPKAFIEVNDGIVASEELAERIREYCVGKLPDYQIPDVIEFREALPRTERGKVDYRSLERGAEKES